MILQQKYEKLLLYMTQTILISHLKIIVIEIMYNGSLEDYEIEILASEK